MDELIHAKRSPRPPPGCFGHDGPDRGVTCVLGEGSLRVDFLADRDVARVLAHADGVALPPALCAGIRNRLDKLAATPILAVRHQTIVEGDGFTLWLGEARADFDVTSGWFIAGELVEWRAAVDAFLRGGPGHHGRGPT